MVAADRTKLACAASLTVKMTARFCTNLNTVVHNLLHLFPVKHSPYKHPGIALPMPSKHVVDEGHGHPPYGHPPSGLEP